MRGKNLASEAIVFGKERTRTDRCLHQCWSMWQSLVWSHRSVRTIVWGDFSYAKEVKQVETVNVSSLRPGKVAQKTFSLVGEEERSKMVGPVVHFLTEVEAVRFSHRGGAATWGLCVSYMR